MEKSVTSPKLRTIARSGDLRIAILEQVDESLYDDLIEVSESLAEKFGESALLNETTISRYFDYPGTYPFIAMIGEEVIGYIIGVPLERFVKDSWARFDKNLGKKNTVYTYAFAFKKRFHRTGYAKVLKRVYYNWMRKRQVEYISGHVIEGITRNFNGNTEVIKKFENWHGTGHNFEYYRRALGKTTDKTG